MGAITGVIFVVVLAVIFLVAYLMRGLSSRAQDRKETADLRTARQMSQRVESDRGTGIN